MLHQPFLKNLKNLLKELKELKGPRGLQELKGPKELRERAQTQLLKKVRKKLLMEKKLKKKARTDLDDDEDAEGRVGEIGRELDGDVVHALRRELGPRSGNLGNA